MEPRVFPTGERPNPNVLYSVQQSLNGGVNLGNWTHFGPLNGNLHGGIGRVNCIAFHPDNSSIMLAGAPAGGVWKSTDGGVTWTTNTDLLPNLGVSDIAYDPIHPDTIYLATGDRDAADTYSIGLLKSVDGGATWQTTGMSYTVQQSRRIGGVYVNPKNTQEVVVATRSGIYKSTDGAATFSLAQGGSWQMLTYAPTSSDTLYAGSNIGGNISRSTDAGSTWTALSNGLPVSGVSRVELATTADDPNYVYAVFSASNNGLYGVYRSTDAGSTWTQQLAGSSKNLLHWDANPSGNTSAGSSGGQGWYDLAIAVSPVNKNIVYVGGVNVWRSTNGGSTWSLSAHWYGGGGAAFTHADQHKFVFKPGTGTLYLGNDGGVYSTADGNSYSSLNDGLHITQYYRIDGSESDAEIVIGGAQDNGTHLFDNPNWDRVRGGDGMDNAIAETNSNVMYAAFQYGSFGKSTNRGQSFNANFNLPPNGSGQWVTPFVIDPNDDNILYAGYNQLWKSTNAGASFAATSSSISGSTNSGIDVIAVSKSNSSVIYIAINNSVYKSSNGGSSWTLITGNISNTRTVTDIAISDVDENHIWITKSGYDANAKVFESFNAGTTWTNVTGSLPNLPVNTIIHQDGTNGSIYVGTDIGVYYMDAGATDWVAYMSGLPNVIVNDLEIHYGTGKIKAGTYGRGMWESPLASSFLGKPQAGFTANPSTLCSISDTISLTDESLFLPTSWTWDIYPTTFNYVNGTNSSSQHPEVVFSANGSYTVQLIVQNNSGADTIVKVGAIGVGGLPLSFSEDFTNGMSEDFLVVNPDGGITWADHSAGAGSVFMDFFNYSSVGAKDELLMPVLDFTGFNNVELVYDVAYRTYPNAVDSLNIYVSTDCGASWALLDARGEDGTLNFATGTAMTTMFTPTVASDWRTDTLDLSAYSGMSSVRIKFEGVSDYGNNLYLDNINVTGSVNAAPVADFYVNDTTCEGTDVYFYNTSGVLGQTYSWTFSGGTPSTSTSPNPIVNYTTSGTYDVSLVVGNSVGNDSVYKTSAIVVESSSTPSVAVSANATAICQGEDIEFYAAPVNGGASGAINWYVNGVQRGLSGDTITLNQLSNGDTVVAVLQSSEKCAFPRVVSSADYIVTVRALPTVDAGSYSAICIGESPIVLSGTPAGGSFSGNGVSGSSFDPSTAGVGTHAITYEYTDANGCSNTDVVNISVQTPPTVFLSGSTFCESDPSKAVSGGFPFGGTYTLNGNTITQVDPSALGVGKHYFEYTFDNGTCEGVAGDTITVLAAPSNPTITVDWGILTCDLVGYQYQWLNSNGTPISGETDRVFYPSTPGDYAVRVRAGSSCSATSAYVTIENVSVEERMAGKIDLRVFPNPTSDFVNLSFTLDDQEEVQVELVDVTGRTILIENRGELLGENRVTLDLKPYASGVYFVKLTVGDVTMTKRVVRE